MTFLIKGRKYQQRVRFVKRTIPGPESHVPSSASKSLHYDQHQIQRPDFIIEHSQDSHDIVDNELGASSHAVVSLKTTSMIPDLYTTLPHIRDLLQTGSSRIQDETIQECLPFLAGANLDVQYNEHGVPHLDRQRHINFLHKSLRKLPAPYVAADASRPWMFYWALAGLAAMGEDISPYKERLISTVQPIQNSIGGFGGGNGQMSHLAPTYAILLSLVIVGGEEALEIIDRKAMWKWLGALKQPDGGFQMCVGGEEDVR